MREVANNLNVGHLMLLLQFGNMGKDLAKYNTKLFAEKVMPQLTRRLFGMGGPLVAAADGARRAGAADAVPASRRWRPNEGAMECSHNLPLRPLAGRGRGEVGGGAAPEASKATSPSRLRGPLPLPAMRRRGRR